MLIDIVTNRKGLLDVIKVKYGGFLIEIGAGVNRKAKENEKNNKIYKLMNLPVSFFNEIYASLDELTKSSRGLWYVIINPQHKTIRKFGKVEGYEAPEEVSQEELIDDKGVRNPDF